MDLDFVVGFFCPLCRYKLGKDSSNPGNVSQVCTNPSPSQHWLPSAALSAPSRASADLCGGSAAPRGLPPFCSPGDHERNPQSHPQFHMLPASQGRVRSGTLGICWSGELLVALCWTGSRQSPSLSQG